MVAIPAPTNIRKTPNASARHACHKHLEVIFPRTTCTFHVAPENEKQKQILNQSDQIKAISKVIFLLPDAGQALRTGPNEIFRRLCHFVATPRACISKNTQTVSSFTSVWMYFHSLVPSKIVIHISVFNTKSSEKKKFRR